MKTRLPAVPLLLPLGAFTAGIPAVVFSDISFWWLIAVAASAAVLAITLRWRGVGALCIMFAAGCLCTGIAKPPKPDFARLSDCEALYAGYVTEVKCIDVMQYLVVAVDSADGRPVPKFRARVTLLSATPPVAPGDRVRFRSTLLPPDYASERLPTRGDIEIWCLRNRVAALAPDVNEKDFDITGYSPGFDVLMERLRYRLSDIIHRSGLSAGAADMMDALITGDRRFLDPEVQQDFRSAGLAHVLALSGTHIAIIAFLVSLILFPLRLIGKRNWQGVLTMLLLWGFALFTGMAASVMRAVIMASMLIIGQLIRRNTVPLNTLCAAALIILVFRPYDLFAVGFQLTFLAVTAILMFAGWANNIRNGALRLPAQWVAVSVSAVLGTAPLAAWYFHSFPTTFLISNLIMGILLPVFIVFGLLSVVSAGTIPVFVEVTDTIYRFSVETARYLGNFMAGEIDGIIFTPWALLPYYIGVAMLWLALEKRRAAYFFNSIILIIFASFLALRPVYPYFEAYPTGNRYATVVLAREGGNAYVFTDATGGSSRLIKRTVPFIAQDYLRTHGVDTLRMATDDLATENLKYSLSEWIIGNTRYVVGRKSPDLQSIAPGADYLIISQGFNAPVKEVTAKLRPGHVIISPRYNRRRRYAMADSLKSLGYRPIMRY